MKRSKRMLNDLDQDIRDHIERETQENIERGMSPEEARYAALRKFGNVTRVKEDTREVWSFDWLEQLWRDIRYGLRMLRKNPGFTAVAVLTLALGIGANSAIFSIVNAVLLRPLPYKDPAQLMDVRTGNFSKGFIATSPPDFRALRERNHSFENLSAYYGAAFTLTGTQEAEQLQGDIVSSEFFATLGVRPLLGRAFLPGEEQWGEHRVVVVSEPFWRTHLDAAPNLSGETLRLNGEQYTVIGVVPAGFHFLSERQLWVPMAWAPGDDLNSHNNYFLSMVGRLKHGVTPSQADADLNGIMAGIAQQFPENKGIGADLRPLRDALVGNARVALFVLVGAVGFLLLIACVNLANLLLARGAGRLKEVAIRSALGAGRGRLLRQFLTESVLLAAVGGAIGLAIAYLSLGLLPMAGNSLPGGRDIRIDGWVIAFTFAISIITGLLFGCGPGFESSPKDLNARLKEGGRTSSVGMAGGKLRAGLVITEVGLSLVLLVGAGLIVQSFERLLRVDSGFDPRHVLTFQIDMPKSIEAGVNPLENGAPPRMLAFFNQLLSRVEGLPGVQAAGVTSALPLQGENWTKYISFGDRPAPSSLDRVAQVQYRSVDGEYFRALGIPLVRGRVFSDADGSKSPLVAIVSRALAERFWPNQDPIGKIIWMAPPENLLPPGALPKGYHIPRQTVVGVVDDVRYGSLDKEGLPVVYEPMAQGDYFLSMRVAVRTQGDPNAMAPSVRTALSEIDKNQPMADVRTMEEVWTDSITQPRLETLLLGVFSALGLALAAVGIYGVMSYSVAQHTHEIGVRMALGAEKSAVLSMVIGQGMKLALIGGCAGVVGALGVTRLMASLLYGVKPTDPVTFAAVSGVLFGVALLACYVPARRATKVDPMVALRHE
jgi:putative ABC transport system permease protein